MKSAIFVKVAYFLTVTIVFSAYKQITFYNSLYHALNQSLYHLGITKPCTHLHPAPSTSTQLHPTPPSSIHFYPAHFNLHPAPSTSTQLISVSTQLSATPSTIFGYIARNWANLDRKIKSCPFSLKSGAHGILEVLFLNPDLDFWNSDPKIHFWTNLGPNIQSCPFCLKIGTQSISRILIPNTELGFWKFDLKIHFWANLGPKIQRCPFYLKIGAHGISSMLILIPTLVLWISNPNFLFGQIWAKKLKVVRFNWKLMHMASWKCRFQIRI